MLEALKGRKPSERLGVGTEGLLALSLWGWGGVCALRLLSWSASEP